VAGHFSVCGSFAKGGDKELRPTMHSDESVLSRPYSGRKAIQSSSYSKRPRWVARESLVLAAGEDGGDRSYLQKLSGQRCFP
jgi:hypothetical protein